MKTESELCNAYIEIIKNNKCHDRDKLNAILKVNKNEFSIKCMMDLSDYYDIIDNELNTIKDIEFNYHLKKEYGITKEYNEKMDSEFSLLGAVLWEDEKETMIQNNKDSKAYHDKYYLDKYGITNGYEKWLAIKTYESTTR